MTAWFEPPRDPIIPTLEEALSELERTAQARRLYPKFGQPGHSRVTDEEPVLREFGTIAIRVEVKGAYEGEHLLLYDNGDRYGYLCCGWGSSGYPEMLYYCDTYSELQDAIDRLHNSIVWLPTPEAVVTFIHEHDWEGDYVWSSQKPDVVRFQRMVLDYIGAQE